MRYLWIVHYLAGYNMTCPSYDRENWVITIQWKALYLPRLAEFMMRDLETTCLSSPNFKPICYYRYVDIFCIIPFYELDNIFRTFNDYGPRLQFTVEKEVNRSLNFIDVTLTVKKVALLTNRSRKPTFS